MTATPTPLRERHAQIAAMPLEQTCGGHLSHDEAASAVRMLMRSDLDHEAVCTIARDRIVWLAGRVAELEAALSARDEAGAVYRCDYCGSDYTRAKYCCQARRDYLNAHGEYEIATPPASGEAEAVDGPDAAWKQASSEVFSTPLSQVREKYGTGDLYKAIASRADELRATPPAASSGDGIESVRRAIEDYIAEMRCLAHTDWADLTNFVNAQFRRLAAVAPAGMVLVPREPTPEMIAAGRHASGSVDCLLLDYDNKPQHDFVFAYRAMLAAAPTPPATAGQE